MNQLGIRSPSAKVGGLVYFGRMLDKIRAHEKNELPPDYQPISAEVSMSSAPNFCMSIITMWPVE